MDPHPPSELMDGATRCYSPASAGRSASRSRRGNLSRHELEAEVARTEQPQDSSKLHADAETFLTAIIELGLLPIDVVDRFLAERENRLADYATGTQIGQALVQAGLLTSYQLD